MYNTMKVKHIAAALAAFFIFASVPAEGAGDPLPVLMASVSYEQKAEAVQAINAKEFDRAITLLEEAVSRNPFDETVKEMLAKAYKARAWDSYSRDGFEDGFDDFRKANSYEKDKHADTYLGLGYGSFRLKNFDDALYYLYDAVYLDPDEPNGHQLIGSIKYQRGELEEAIDEWELAIAIEPENEDLGRMLAKAKKEFKVEGSFNSTETYYFNIKYEGYERRDLGDMVLEILDGAYRDVGGDLDYYPREPVTVILYTQKQFTDITDAPAWSGGIFDGNIRIPVGGKVDRHLLSVVLYHEYAHAVTTMIAGRVLPTWLNEGIAQYEERWVRDLGTDVRPARLFPLSSLDGSFVGISNPLLAKAAYDESLSVVMFFVERFGKYNLAKLVRLLGEGVGKEEAVRRCTGISFEEFESYWRGGVSG